MQLVPPSQHESSFACFSERPCSTLWDWVSPEAGEGPVHLPSLPRTRLLLGSLGAPGHLSSEDSGGRQDLLADDRRHVCH